MKTRPVANHRFSPHRRAAAAPRCTAVATPRCTATPRRTAAGFTLAELLITMVVTGVILSAVVTLTYTLNTYNGEGEAAVDLATNGRFAMMRLEKDVRTAGAVSLTSNGSLMIWTGDTNGNTFMDVTEFVVYYRVSSDRTLRRVNYSTGPTVGAISPASLAQMVGFFNAGLLDGSTSFAGIIVKNRVYCRHVDKVTFKLNRAAPQALCAETLVELSRQENLQDSSGRTVLLKFYDTATMRAPYKLNGFRPQS